MPLSTIELLCGLSGVQVLCSLASSFPTNSNSLELSECRVSMVIDPRKSFMALVASTALLILVE